MGLQNIELEITAGQHATGDTQTRFAHKYGISLEEAGEQIAHISAMGRAEGLDFATTLFTNTMDAHRRTKLAQRNGLATPVIQALFKTYFTDKNVLRSVGVDCGLKANAVEEVLNSDAFQDEVVQDEREAHSLEINAVPFFVIGRHGISGCQSVMNIMEVLREAHTAHVNAEQDQGARCGSEGCRIG